MTSVKRAGTIITAQLAPVAQPYEDEEDKLCPLFLNRGIKPPKGALAVAGALVEASERASSEDEAEQLQDTCDLENACRGVRSECTEEIIGDTTKSRGVPYTHTTTGSRDTAQGVNRRRKRQERRPDPLASTPESRPRRGRSAGLGETQVLLRLWGDL